MHDRSNLLGAILFVLLVTLAIAACAGAATPTTPASPSAATPDAPISTVPPSDGGNLAPIDGAKVVVPRPGQLDVRPIGAETLRATVDGRSVEIAVDWWSGVEPCTVLDSIVVERGAGSFAITLREGSGPGEMACIAIAEHHRAFIDLGELDPGTYTISDATGSAPAIEVVVP